MARRHSNHRDYLLVAVAVTVAACLAVGDASSGVGFDLHHRSSPVVRRWAEARGHPALAAEWPAKGSPEYYSKLSRHDRALLARRGLATAGGLLTFADGNETIQSLGSLYYAEVALGTPNTTFLVALDTGSDLFWVPCDCKQCAQLPSGNNGTGTAAQLFRPYSPKSSSTSKTVTCDNSLCTRTNGCSAATNGSCPYTVQYASANTSSSGVLVEDVLHLISSSTTEAVNASVVFGCGQVQTGDFLDGAGFDGLLGLGRGKVSVPSELAAAGLVASDSFSMCFGDDGVGRINLGDAGSSSGQSETPFIASPVYYNVSFTSINVEGESAAAVEFAAIVDSGTSYTYLNDPEYTQLATKFNSQIREKRANFSTFEYCYGLSSNQTEVLLPDVSLTTSGGALFPVTSPIIAVVSEINGQARFIGYCLALLKTSDGISSNIIGQNFMTGLKVVFNRERSVLGWQKFDCYKNAPVADGPAASPGPAGSNPTKITPQQNNGGNTKPDAAPLPSSTGSLGAARALGGRLSLLLPLLAAAALV